jgi:2-keto-myo-inositol isomerase
MKLSLNGATTMKADLATDVRVAAGAGFDGLEIWAAKLRDYLASHTSAELRSLLDEHGIEPYSINSIEHVTFRDGAGKEIVEAECEELCHIAHNIGCPYVVAVPGLLPEGAARADVIGESVTWLSRLGGRAQCHDVGIAFEFLGQPGCSVQTLELADEIVRQVARPNVGLVIDSFHFYAGGSTIESIAALDADRLFIFHINDAEDRPRGQLEDRHRLLPGLGILPLEEIVAALHRIGYDGVASVEIFRPEYWDRDPQELARASWRAAASVLRRYEDLNG